MKNNILIGVLLGVGASLIDLVPMIFQGLILWGPNRQLIA